MISDINELLSSVIDGLVEETYKQTMNDIFDTLKIRGWKTSSPDLKIRWAEDPDGSGYRLWFKKQAVYYSWSSSFQGALSLHVGDIRGRKIDTIINDDLMYGKKLGSNYRD